MRNRASFAIFGFQANFFEANRLTLDAKHKAKTQNKSAVALLQGHKSATAAKGSFLRHKLLRFLYQKLKMQKKILFAH